MGATRYLTVVEVMERLQLRETTTRALIRDEIGGHYFGRQLRVSEEDLLEYEARQRVPPASAPAPEPEPEPERRRRRHGSRR